MQCPVCKDVTLVMSERQGIEVDYCPQCRGVWLDRGELDKLIDRGKRDHAYDDDRPRAHHDRAEDDYYRHKRPKKRESFLGEIFDFG
jgi:uncharacterized protein